MDRRGPDSWAVPSSTHCNDWFQISAVSTRTISFIMKSYKGIFLIVICLKRRKEAVDVTVGLATKSKPEN